MSPWLVPLLCEATRTPTKTMRRTRTTKTPMRSIPTRTVFDCWLLLLLMVLWVWTRGDD